MGTLERVPIFISKHSLLLFSVFAFFAYLCIGKLVLPAPAKSSRAGRQQR